MAIANPNFFRVSLKKGSDRALLDAIKKKVKKIEGVELTDAGVIRRALVTEQRKLDREIANA